MINKILGKTIKYPLRLKLFLITVVIVTPMILLSLYQIAALRNYSTAYDRIVKNITSANNYNLNFKDELDESMYKIVVEAETFETIDDNDVLKNPYQLIEAARNNFIHLQEITTNRISQNWIKRILHNLDTLEDRTDEIRDNLKISGHYEENLAMLESDIYILTELLQEEIQYYIYYESQSLEAIRQSLNEQVTDVIIIMIVALAVIMSASVIVNIIVSKSITKPISQLCEKTALVAQGDFTARAVCDNQDEIALLTESFNDMAEKLEQQVERIRQEQENLRNMELKLLQTQINPHFLYNTLDTIIWLIEGKKNTEAIDIVVSLSEFFRIAVSKGKDYISIYEEEMHIRSYLVIQQSRYKDILEYEINIPKELYAYQILKLTLQPLVENSIYHGIKMLRSKGKITVIGEKTGEDITLRVIDNGVGMEEEALDSLRKGITLSDSEQSAGFGLRNVDERIKLIYGSQYGLEINSKIGEGTIISVTIPARLMEHVIDTEGIIRYENKTN